MYTQCPKCGTVFRITAAQLRVAEGEVRCGNCTISFNALGALTDDLPELTDAVVLGSRQEEEIPVDDAPEHESPAARDDDRTHLSPLFESAMPPLTIRYRRAPRGHL